MQYIFMTYAANDILLYIILELGSYPVLHVLKPGVMQSQQHGVLW